MYFRFNPCIFSFNSLTLDSILVFSHSIPLLYIQSLYFLIQFPYFRFNPCISGSILVFHLLSFHFQIGMSVLSFGNFRTGKIPYSSVKVHFNFPTHGIAVVVKKLFHHSRLRRSWWNNYSPRLLCHSWGNSNVPFLTHREFLIPSLAALPLVKELSRPKIAK